MNLETRTFPCTFKSIDSDGALFTGIVAAFNSPDHGRDIIHPRAYDDGIAEFRKSGYVRFEHESTIGKVIDAQITPQGLVVKGRISDTSLGRDAKVLLKDGVLDKLSIGQYIQSRSYLETPDEVRGHWASVGYTPTASDLSALDGGPIRLITKARPVEASIVYNPMQPLATITSVKSRRDQLIESNRLYADFLRTEFDFLRAELDRCVI